MKALWAARQLSYMQSLSAHTLLSVSKVTVATASRILPVSSDKVSANGGTCTASLMHPQKKKLWGMWSGDRGGQVTGPPLESISLETWDLRSPSLPFENVETRYVFLEQSLTETLFFQNTHEKFICLKRQFLSECNVSGEKNCKQSNTNYKLDILPTQMHLFFIPLPSGSWAILQ